MAGKSSPSNHSAIATQVVAVQFDNSQKNSPLGQGFFNERDDAVELEARRMENAACYVVSRADDRPLLQKVMNGPEDLQNVLLGLSQRTTLGSPSSSSPSRNETLVVVHGLPLQYVQVLSSELGVPADVVKAIANRGRYRRPLYSNTAASAALSSVGAPNSYEYPELVESVPYRPHVVSEKEEEKEAGFVRDPGDVLDDPPRCSVSNTGEAIFCRATVWEGEKASVLFLDRPLWNDPLCFFEKMSHGEARSLERRVWDALGSDVVVSLSGILSAVLGVIAFELWAEFFEALRPNPCTSISEFGDLFGRAQHGLERNLDASRSGGAVQQNSGDKAAQRPLTVDWQSILDRLERHRRLALDLRTLTAQEEARHQQQHHYARSSRNYDKYNNKKKNNSNYEDEDDSSGRDIIDRQDVSNADENRRSLDRVSYLGAVLLPITIVSGILSMDEQFGPYGDMFYVFWAVAMPLTAATLLIIYADSIRREVVWVEASVTQGSSRDNNESVDFGEHGDDDDKKNENDGGPHHRRFGKRGGRGKKTQRIGAMPPPPRPPQQETVSMPDLEQGIAYSYTEPLPISERMNISLPPPDDEEDADNSEDDDTASVPSTPPVMMLQSRFAKSDQEKAKTWKKQELGWLGAAKCILRLAQVKKARRLPRNGRTGDVVEYI